MAGVPKWRTERIQHYKSMEGISSDDEDFIDHLVEVDMQRTSLSISQNPPIMTTIKLLPTASLKKITEPRDPRLRKRKANTYSQTTEGQEKAEKVKKKTKNMEELDTRKNPNDHYPLKEQIKGAWYVIFSTPQAPPATPPHY